MTTTLEMTSADGITQQGKTPFDEHPRFYLEDNRRFRGRNPITKTTLDAKMGVLLPEWVVRGKTVLDLGSCLGAAGHWALYYGALKYVGVELQQEYVTTSRELLAPWGDKAEIIQRDIRAFLAKTPAKSFDVVLAMGILYLFVDPEFIVRELCRISKEVVAVESILPSTLQGQSIHEPRVMITEYYFDQNVNMADGNYSLSGIAASASPAALDLFFRLQDYVNREGLLEFPLLSDTAIYSHASTRQIGMASRFAARYFSVHGQSPLKTLEENLPSKTGVKHAWNADAVHLWATDQLGKLAKSIGSEHKPWQFDEQVAASFEEIARTSIPHYDVVLDKTVEIVRKKQFIDPKIIDVGSAVGGTLKRFYEAGFRNLYGVDSSKAMLDRSFDKATLIHSGSFPVDHGPFDAIVANWVLHFIPNRERYLAAMQKSLKPGGVLVLTEKVISSEITNELYFDFKRRSGVTDEQIEAKKHQLVGVLVPYPLTWYFETLSKLGFKQVDVVDAHYAFVTMVAEL